MFMPFSVFLLRDRNMHFRIISVLGFWFRREPRVSKGVSVNSTSGVGDGCLFHCTRTPTWYSVSKSSVSTVRGFFFCETRRTLVEDFEQRGERVKPQTHSRTDALRSEISNLAGGAEFNLFSRRVRLILRNACRCLDDPYFHIELVLGREHRVHFRRTASVPRRGAHGEKGVRGGRLSDDDHQRGEH